LKIAVGARIHWDLRNSGIKKCVRNSVFCCVDAAREGSADGDLRLSAALQPHCSPNLALCDWAISLGSLSRLCAAQLKTKAQSTFSSPRYFVWRSGPVYFSQPKLFSTNQRRLRLMA